MVHFFVLLPSIFLSCFLSFGSQKGYHSTSKTCSYTLQNISISNAFKNFNPPVIHNVTQSQVHQPNKQKCDNQPVSADDGTSIQNNTNHNTSNKTILQIKFKQLKINENRYRNHTTPLEPKRDTCVYYRRCTQTKIK